VRAKALGGGRVAPLDEASARELRERIGLEHALADAVDHDGLELAYQPIVSLADGHTAYAEALLRWRRRDAGLVPPSEFVPVAEESGLIRRLGRWVLETACREHGAWALAEPESAPPRVAVNVSAREIVDPGFPEAVAAVIERTGVTPAALVLEVTETAMLDATDSARDVMQRLTDLGIQIVLDDFGDGFSSLAHLRWFPVHGLKIDRSLIADLGVRPEARPIVEAVVAMARAVGIGTVAEGIETDAQLDAVRELGCDFAQGYALGRPAPPPGT
jgi:EAL domain-containing protein (putative c-di-GMP-specific phosphodiesterase class I)